MKVIERPLPVGLGLQKKGLIHQAVSNPTWMGNECGNLNSVPPTSKHVEPRESQDGCYVHKAHCEDKTTSNRAADPGNAHHFPAGNIGRQETGISDLGSR